MLQCVQQAMFELSGLLDITWSFNCSSNRMATVIPAEVSQFFTLYWLTNTVVRIGYDESEPQVDVAKKIGPICDVLHRVSAQGHHPE